MYRLIAKFCVKLFPGFCFRNLINEEQIATFLYRAFNPVMFLKRKFHSVMSYPPSGPDVTLHNAILSLPDRVAAQFQEEIDYLITLPPDNVPVFPYPRVKESMSNVVYGFDADKKLSYVMHGDKRLYFGVGKSPKMACQSYKCYVEEEGILGTGCNRKSPHSYVSDSFMVEKGDVVLDVGAAEALFALDNVEKASRVYIFESEKPWQEANVATFQPYGEKVSIFNKIVGDHTDSNIITIQDAVKDESSDAVYFIKMDIEGAELNVIKNAEDFLCSHKVKLACAAYHRYNDAETITALLKSFGFTCEYSEGYMLPTFDGTYFPYFRRGMIRARNF